MVELGSHQLQYPVEKLERLFDVIAGRGNYGSEVTSWWPFFHLDHCSWPTLKLSYCFPLTTLAKAAIALGLGQKHWHANPKFSPSAGR